ncbi:MAG: Xaa-Pro dipeptidase [Lysobacteraceae bacterium]
MSQAPSPAALYPEHLATVIADADAALADSGFDHLLVAAGVEKIAFLDDNPYPFRANPHFRRWLPVDASPGCWVAHTPGRRPLLVFVQPDDFWHLPPSTPEDWWAGHFDLRIVRNAADAAQHLPRGRCAVIGEDDAGLRDIVPNNPGDVLARLHWRRAVKTPYEVARMREANARAARGHLAAREAFGQKLPELGIHHAYLAASAHTDDDLPYHSIVGLNAHGAVLHYQHRATARPPRHRSLLIDAGAQSAGYCADITRTLDDGDADFRALVDAVDGVERELAARVRPGQDYVALHLDAHHRLGGVLQASGIVAMDAADQVDAGITRAFFPHGLGHFIGLQVHDVGGHQSGPGGERRPPPPEHPFLRLTRTLEPGHAVTIEPGIYFIDSFLADLRAGPHADRIDWSLVEHLKPFGGVRIEDDVVCTDDAPENLSRDAFAAL